MFKKIYFLIVFMFFIILPNSVKASTISGDNNIPAISNIYTEGFYRFDNPTNIDMVVLLTNDVPAKFIIFDNEMNVEFLSDLPYNDKFYIHKFAPGQIVGIVGEGKVALSFEPIKK